MNLFEQLCLDLCQSRTWLDRVVLRAPFAYKTFYIDKKNGGKRSIDQPARETKIVQYWLIKNVLKDLPISDSATAYRKGGGIKKNAEHHKGSRFICKFDFKDFFPSITEVDVVKHLRKNIKCLSDKDVEIISRLVVKKDRPGISGRLTIGAPTSPIISNSIMFDFDEELAKELRSQGVVYSRYADDMTFSSINPIDVKWMNQLISSILGAIEYPSSLQINHKKTIALSKANRRSVTGLTLTNDGKISIGRGRKRLISAMINNHLKKGLDHENLVKLQGLLSFANDIEGNFLSRMISKYGVKEVMDIVKYNGGRG